MNQLYIKDYNKVSVKNTYSVPNIKLILLDNEVSLALQSPPSGPEEVIANSFDYEMINNNDRIIV